MARKPDVTPPAKSATMRSFVHWIRAAAPYVVLMTSGNLGAAPFFPWPLNRLMTWRARRQRDLLRALAVRHGVAYVDLWREVEDDPFRNDPARYYAADGLHLTGEGYAQWHGELVRQADLDRVLEAARSSDPGARAARRSGFRPSTA